MRSSAPMPGAPTLIVPRDLDPLREAGATRQTDVVQMLACRASQALNPIGKASCGKDFMAAGSL